MEESAQMWRSCLPVCAHYNSSDIFFFKCWEKKDVFLINASSTANIEFLLTEGEFVFPQWHSQAFLRLRLWICWGRQAASGVSRGPGQHYSPGWRYKHLAPLAPVIHGCLLPSNRTHKGIRKVEKWHDKQLYPNTPQWVCCSFQDFPNPKKDSFVGRFHFYHT